MKLFEPWDKPLRERLGMLRDGTHRIAYFAPKPDSGSFRYRCYNTTQAINAYGKETSASYFFLDDLDQINDLSAHADTLVVFRTPYDTHVDRVITKFQRARKKVFFDVDDLIFDVKFAPLVTSNLNYRLTGKDIDQWFSFIANIGACMKLCDHVITTNAFIADRVAEYSGLPVSVIPNFVNQEQLETSEDICARKGEPRQQAGLRLGYFSGSHSHAKDFAVAQAGVAKFLSESPESTLTILGHLDLPSELSRFKGRVIRKPFMNFLELQWAMSEVDVNLVPLQLSPFTFSKSELKFFESALVKTITVATPTPLFSAVIKSGENGFLTPASGWSQTLDAVEQLSALERAKIATSAHADALDLYSPQLVEPRLSSLFLESK
tara:strand:- start:3212 stop:4348 length:1137 start_codon:yes stop_codon:yes gene_type:complete